MPGEVFGEADVILKVRLNELQQELDQAEMLVTQQAQRVHEVQLQTMQSVRRAGEEADSSSSAIGSIATAVGSWKLLTLVVGRGTAALMAFRVAAMAAKAAALALTTGGVLLLLAAVGAMVDAIYRTERAIRDISRATAELDGTKQRVLELSDAISRLPVVGGLASRIFRIFSGNTEVADNALLGFVGTIEDGQVKLGGFRRALLHLFGGGGIVSDIDDINERLREMNARLEETAAFQGFAGGQVDRLDVQAGDAEQAIDLFGLEGLERVREENRIRHDEAMRFFESEQRALNEQVATQRRSIEAQRDSGEIEAAEARVRLSEVNRRSSQQQLVLNERQREVMKSIVDLAKRREQAAAEEEEAQRRLVELETERYKAASQSMGLRAAGRGAEADLADIEAQRQQAIGQAEENGYSDRLDAINRYYDAAAAIAMQRQAEDLAREQEYLERKAEQDAEAAERQEQRREGVESQLRAARLRLGGNESGARREEIIQSFESQIDAAIKSGDGALLKSLQDLRDARLALLKQQEDQDALREAERAKREREREAGRGMFASSMQIDTALTSLRGGGDPKAEEKRMVEEQKKTNQELKRQRVARAG